MILHQFDNGDTLERCDRALIARFAGRRRVLGTSALNGGLRDTLETVFNQDCKENGAKKVPLKAATYEDHLKLVAEELGLDPLSSTGLTTAADMDNAVVVSETYRDLTVTAAVTGGIDVNGGRTGDPADWHEADGVSIPAAEALPDVGGLPPAGTINILLFVSARLPEGTMARALVTCTEAKTAALQELLAPSCYSSGIATGSGTDGTVVVSDLTSPVLLTFAGKHSKLGELIGRTVMKAVKEALYLQTGLGTAQQLNIFSRIGRYGITREALQAAHRALDLDKLVKTSFQSGLVVMTSLYVHLLDQLSWGLLLPRDAVPAANRLLVDMGMDVRISAVHPSAKSAVDEMVAAYRQGLLKKVMQ
jgi:adenosylcobinamide amidohydrolase